MKPHDVILDCLREFDRVRLNGGVSMLQLTDNKGLPSMCRASNGEEIWFSSRALECLDWLAQYLHHEPGLEAAVRLEEFTHLVRQALVDGYCDGRLAVSNEPLLAGLRSMVASAVELSKSALIHSFPAWSIDTGESVVRVGPAAIYPVDQWLERQRFAPNVVERFFTDELPESAWRLRFDEYRAGRSGQHRDPAWLLFRVIGDASHVVEVSVPPKETSLSRAQARLLAQAALDCLALIFDGPVFHRHWVLRDHPTAPELHDHITAFESGLWHPVVQKRFHRSPFSAAENQRALEKYSVFLGACTHVLNTVLFGGLSAPSIGLAQRWFAGLLWASEAAREPNDAMASAKFVTSLDIMAQANKADPIVKMVSLLTGLKPDEVVVPPDLKHANGMTMKQVVERIYGVGRSQVLHGSIIDPMRRHDWGRGIGGWLARNCLRAVVRIVPKASDSDIPNFSVELPIGSSTEDV